MMRGVDNWSLAVRRPDDVDLRRVVAARLVHEALPRAQAAHRARRHGAGRVARGRRARAHHLGQPVDRRRGRGAHQAARSASRCVVAFGFAILRLLPGAAGHHPAVQGAARHRLRVLAGRGPACASPSSSSTCSIITQFRDLRRVFEYHGAEHMSIHALEHGDELTVGQRREVQDAAPALRHVVPARS